MKRAPPKMPGGARSVSPLARRDLATDEALGVLLDDAGDGGADVGGEVADEVGEVEEDARAAVLDEAVSPLGEVGVHDAGGDFDRGQSHGVTHGAEVADGVPFRLVAGQDHVDAGMAFATAGFGRLGARLTRRRSRHGWMRASRGCSLVVYPYLSHGFLLCAGY